METNKVKAIEMTRAIRDKNAQQLMGKSHAERIVFYHKQAGKMQIKLSALLTTLQTEEVKSDKNQAE